MIVCPSVTTIGCRISRSMPVAVIVSTMPVVSRSIACAGQVDLSLSYNNRIREVRMVVMVVVVPLLRQMDRRWSSSWSATVMPMIHLWRQMR